MAAAHIIDVTFGYDAKYIPPRCRLDSNTRCRGVVAVQIREIRELDAPVAIEIDGIEEDGGTRQIRHDGEGFLRPMRGPYGDFLSLDEFTALAAEGRYREYHDRNKGYWPDYPFPRRISRHEKSTDYEDVFHLHTKSEAGGRWVEDSREEAEIEAHKAAQEVVVIDGIMHLRCPEPYWALDMGHYSDDKLRLMLRDPENVSRSNYTTVRPSDSPEWITARADRGHALEELRRLSGADDRFKVIRSPDCMRVLMPEVLTRDDYAIGCAATLGPFVNKLSESAGNYRNVDTIRAFCDLRDAVTRWRDGGDPSAAADGVDALRRMADHGLQFQDGRDRVGETLFMTHLLWHERYLVNDFVPDADFHTLAAAF